MTKIVGVDPSLNNFGLVKGVIKNNSLTIHDRLLISVKPSKHTYKSVSDYERVKYIYSLLHNYITDVDTAYIEFPIGSQSARAMFSYGVCIALIASFTTKVVHCTPLQVKKAVTGNKEASKADMIEWATSKHPEVEWFTNTKGKLLNKNEHIADAIAAIYACNPNLGA